MPIPDAARRVLARRLEARRQERWPELQDLKISYRTTFAYIEAVTNDGPLKLFRLRYLGSKDAWGFAIYLASKEGYEDSFLPRPQLHRHTRGSARLRLRPLPRRHLCVDRRSPKRFTRELLTGTT
jgi:hypothetical protein